jgi:hypothetical protein
VIAPTIAEVRAWLQVPASSVSDEQMAQVLAAEAAVQGRQCRLVEGADQAHLRQALYRRAGRTIAARGVPLGMLGADAEWGPTRLARWDAEIDRLEGPDRLVVFG